ncbi:hypothetical protein [Actinoplanes utahensis]|uniref:hypothetical protein n=1 Tax=Actinoplanes utahensis TaxID=1869 RepID=UPI00126A5CB8|nr:hypothetical protein [Actinoplanes utahensis]GIF35396.1 hypothetical protein Aut01nite_83820 [Actinoplanes utahensis]
MFDVVGDVFAAEPSQIAGDTRESLAPSGVADTRPAVRRRTWRLVPVDSCSAFELGIHPASEPEADVPRLPPYVSRDHDSELRAQLRRAAENGGGTVVVIGDSSTGKSRSLYEACRQVLAGWQILLAEDPDGIRQARAASSERIVMWLDDTRSPRFLTPSGLTAGDISEWTGSSAQSGPTIVVHLLWPAAYQEIMAPPTVSRFDSRPSPDPWRSTWDCLSLAVESAVWVGATLTEIEKRRAAALAAETGDSRIGDALRDGHYGFTQYLAGAPQLIEHWKFGQASQPYGAAVLTAAIDLTCLGVRVLSSALLTEAMATYLTDEQFVEASPGAAEDALKYATAELRGGVRALRPRRGPQLGAHGGYKLDDYLQQRGELERHYVPVPAALWEVIGIHVTDMDLLSRLALAADDRGLTDHAFPLLSRTYMIDGSARGG